MRSDMKTHNKVSAFALDETGAVTVDWVVLSAAIIGLGVVVVASVLEGSRGVGDVIETSLDTATIDDVGDLSP